MVSQYIQKRLQASSTWIDLGPAKPVSTTSRVQVSTL